MQKKNKTKKHAKVSGNDKSLTCLETDFKYLKICRKKKTIL